MDLWRVLKLDREEHSMVTLVGAGGKTTALYCLARAAFLAGHTVALTTTTHILPHPRLFLTAFPDRETVMEKRVVLVGKPEGAGPKLTVSMEPSRLLALADLVLVEGDGARSLPLKAPAEHEPAIPQATRAVVALAGLDAVGRPIGRVCHRPERVCAILGKGPEDLVSPEDVAVILSHPEGGRKGVPDGAAFRCLLNKANTPRRAALGAEIVARLLRNDIQAAVSAFTERERGGLCWF